MSNVLIGIIGVILFIGLALAGALILGDDFRSASNESKAAAATSGIQQVQSAVEMYRLKTGDTGLVRMGVPNWLAPRFLKTMAANPMPNPGIPYWNTININNDPYPDQGDEGAPLSGRFVVSVLGTGEKARAVCQSVADVNSGGVVSHYYTGVLPTARIGCYVHDTSPSDTNGTFVIYGTI